MKRGIFWAVVVALLTYALTQTSLASDAFLLLVMGVVPGTNWHVPAAVMLVGYPLLAIVAVFWLIHQPMYIGSSKRNDALARELARKRVHKLSAKSDEHQKLVETRRRYRPFKTA